MYVYRYCNNCHKIVSLPDGSFYAYYNPGTKKYKSYFVCSRCEKHSVNRMPGSLTKDELEKLFRSFQIIKDRSDYNLSTLYPIYWLIYKGTDYITTYGTDNEEDFFQIKR